MLQLYLQESLKAKGVASRGLPCYTSDGHLWSIRLVDNQFRVTCKRDYTKNIENKADCEIKTWDLPKDATQVKFGVCL